MWRDEAPTEKQLKLIHSLEKQFGITFNGSTKGEACDFIDKYIGNKDEFSDEYYHYNYENEILNG